MSAGKLMIQQLKPTLSPSISKPLWRRYLFGA
jgi:hypothetical protein